MKKKQENELIHLVTIGVLMVIASFVYSPFVAIRKVGFFAIVIGFIPLFYSIFSQKKRFSQAKMQEVDQMSGFEFEQYCYFLLLNSGYDSAVTTNDGPDQGVDVIATKNKEKYAIQCKRWNKKVGNKAIQEIYAGKDYYQLQHAMVITNHYFTDSAKQLAKKLNVHLWDRDTLTKLIETRHYKKEN